MLRTVLNDTHKLEHSKMKSHTSLLIIGAGPFGLSLAAEAQHLGINYIIVGKPMGFWQENMPDGMFLRSACDWHLDPSNQDTIEAYLQTQGLTSADVEPLSLAFYLDYAAWFQDQQGIEPVPMFVQQLDVFPEKTPRFRATMADGSTIHADTVAIAPGFKPFKNEPAELVAHIPAGRYSHTCEHVDFNDMAGRRCLIVGGRQSAFEWTALLQEAGATAVHVVHRHDTPAFAEADWSWVNPLVDAMLDNPGWFRNLTPSEKDAVNRRLWDEGRLKVEPWLAERVLTDRVQLWPNSFITACDEMPDGTLSVTLNNGTTLTVDHIILATGYRVNINQVSFLAQGNILDNLATADGYPLLDEQFQANIPGLFITSMPATRDFGPFFAFTISVRTSAKLIGRGAQQLIRRM